LSLCYSVNAHSDIVTGGEADGEADDWDSDEDETFRVPDGYKLVDPKPVKFLKELLAKKHHVPRGSAATTKTLGFTLVFETAESGPSTKRN